MEMQLLTAPLSSPPMTSDCGALIWYGEECSENRPSLCHIVHHSTLATVVVNLVPHGDKWETNHRTSSCPYLLCHSASP